MYKKLFLFVCLFCFVFVLFICLFVLRDAFVPFKLHVGFKSPRQFYFVGLCHKAIRNKESEFRMFLFSPTQLLLTLFT